MRTGAEPFWAGNVQSAYNLLHLGKPLGSLPFGRRHLQRTSDQKGSTVPVAPKETMRKEMRSPLANIVLTQCGQSVRIKTMKAQRTMNRLRCRSVYRVIGTACLAIALSACGTAPPATVEPKKVPAADISGKLQSLQRQIQERDKLIEERDKLIEDREKRIEELESQLDALKLIEQDRENQRKPVRPPPTLAPSQ